MFYQVSRMALFVVLFIYIGWPVHLAAQSSCDPALAKLSNGELGYRDRGNRCEGLYIKEVGSTSLQIASFTESFGPLNTKSGKPLLIEWDKPPGNNTVRLRAQGIKHKLYYRMDSFQPKENTSFNWSTNILASLHIQKSDIGIIGTSQYTAGSLQKDLYIPLRITQEGQVAHSDTCNLVLQPGVELKEVYISLAPLQADGHQGKFIKDGEKLGYGYYPAERSITIPVSGLKGSGIYYLEIGAELRNGGTSTLEIWFYHSKG